MERQPSGALQRDTVVGQADTDRSYNTKPLKPSGGLLYTSVPVYAASVLLFGTWQPRELWFCSALVDVLSFVTHIFRVDVFSR